MDEAYPSRSRDPRQVIAWRSKDWICKLDMMAESLRPNRLGG